MNEVDPTDKTDFAAKPPLGITIALLGAFHFICCGIPLLLLSGASLATIFPSWPVIGGSIAVLGIVGFVSDLRKGCATCPGNPKRCSGRECGN